MLWAVKILPKPAHRKTASQKSDGDLPLKPPELTIWNDTLHEDESKGFSLNPEAEEFYGDGGQILFYPELPKGCEDLRNTF